MPNKLTPSAANICAVAIGHFAEHGYDASSLNEIATLAGMRKASLYAHFASKDALFHQAFELALVEELEHAAACFQNESLQAPGAGEVYAERLIERYEQSAHLRFLLRTAYLPPVELRTVITAGFERYLEQIRLAFLEQLQAREAWARNDVSRAEEYAEVYMAIVDSLHVELFYASSAKCRRRSSILLRLLADGLSLAAGQHR